MICNENSLPLCFCFLRVNNKTFLLVQRVILNNENVFVSPLKDKNKQLTNLRHKSSHLFLWLTELAFNYISFSFSWKRMKDVSVNCLSEMKRLAWNQMKKKLVWFLKRHYLKPQDYKRQQKTTKDYKITTKDNKKEQNM